MIKQSYKWGLALLLALVCFNLSLVSFASAHASKTPVIDYSLTLKDAQRILQAATPYVRIINNTAVIDPAITSHLNAGDIAIVRTYVKKFNMQTQAMPIKNQAVSVNMQPQSQGYGIWMLGCYAYIYDSNYWWGENIYMNHCLINNMKNMNWNGVVAPIVGLFVAAIAGSPLAGAAGALVGVIVSIYLGSLVTADSNCNNRGANYVESFGVSWVSAVC